MTDRERARRELRRLEEVAEAADEDRMIREIQRFKARASQVLTESNRAGRDLTPLLNDIFERLAEEEKRAKRKAA